MKIKNASDLLAQAQGGIIVKGILQKRLLRSQVEAIFGKDIPTYTVTETFKVSLKPCENGKEYLLCISKLK